MNDTEMRARVNAILTETDALRRSLDAQLSDLDGQYVQVPSSGRWTKPMVAQLWDASQHLPGVRALFKVTAARPNETVLFDDVLARSGLTPKQQGNEHASRLAFELFETTFWPIQTWQGSGSGGSRAQMNYRMARPWPSGGGRSPADRPVAWAYCGLTIWRSVLTASRPPGPRRVLDSGHRRPVRLARVGDLLGEHA